MEDHAVSVVGGDDLGAFIGRPSTGLVASVWSCFPFRSKVREPRGWTGCHICLGSDGSGRFGPDLQQTWFSLSKNACVFSHSFLFVHAFLVLSEAPTLGRSLVLRRCSQTETSAGPALSGQVCLALSSWHPGLFKGILFCVSLL